MPSWRLGVTSNYFRLAVISWANSIFPFYITGKKAGSPSASVRKDSGQSLVSTARSLLLSPHPHKVYMRVLSLLINNVQISWPHRVTQRWSRDRTECLQALGCAPKWNADFQLVLWEMSMIFAACHATSEICENLTIRWRRIMQDSLTHSVKGASSILHRQRIIYFRKKGYGFWCTAREVLLK